MVRKCEFETRVLPVVTKLARRCFKGDDQKVQDAIGLCWYHYQQCRHRRKVTATSFAQCAVRHTWNGRQLPGVGKKGRGARQDALDHAWRCSDMREARDPSPGPLEMAESADEWAMLLGLLNEKQTAFADICHLGLSNQEIARVLKLSPARISQLRREVLELTKR